jgi:hypothetical protein
VNVAALGQEEPVWPAEPGSNERRRPWQHLCHLDIVPKMACDSDTVCTDQAVGRGGEQPTRKMSGPKLNAAAASATVMTAKVAPARIIQR